MCIGLKCKSTTDGLEGRPLICSENRGTRKIPQVIKKTLSLEKTSNNCVHIQHQSTFLAADDNRVSTFPAKKKTIEMQKVVLCHLYLVGLQIKQCIFLKYFYPRATRKCSSSVVLDVGLWYINVPVKSKVNDPPWALNFWPVIACF